MSSAYEEMGTTLAIATTQATRVTRSPRTPRTTGTDASGHTAEAVETDEGRSEDLRATWAECARLGEAAEQAAGLL